MKRKAFTMIELVFVIVVLGILASIAIPKLNVTRTDAQMTRGMNDVSVIRSSIITTRSENLLKGDATFPPLEKNTGDDMLFDGVLDYPIKEKAANSNNGWTTKKEGNGVGKKYTLTIDGAAVEFDYSNTTGIFTCVGFNEGDTDEAIMARNLCDKLR